MKNKIDKKTIELAFFMVDSGKKAAAIESVLGISNASVSRMLRVRQYLSDEDYGALIESDAYHINKEAFLDIVDIMGLSVDRVLNGISVAKTQKQIEARTAHLDPVEESTGTVAPEEPAAKPPTANESVYLTRVLEELHAVNENMLDVANGDLRHYLDSVTDAIKEQNDLIKANTEALIGLMQTINQNAANTASILDGIKFNTSKWRR